MSTGASSQGSDPASDRAELSDKENHILDAVLAVLARRGIAGVSMRAVAKEAEVALGLMNYYFEDKTSLIAAALRRLGEQDAQIVEPRQDLEPVARLRFALRRVSDDEFLAPDYLSLRLQLWSLAGVDPIFARINQEAQSRYRIGLAELIAAARPDLGDVEVQRRAADVLVVQNGIWLTAIVIGDRASIVRSVERCEHIALGG